MRKASPELIFAAAYDEEDDGFAFTRTRSKKAKAEPSQPSIAEESAPQQRIEPVLPKRTKKRVEERPMGATSSADNGEKVSRRRSARNSGGSQDDGDPPPLPVTKRRKGRGSDEAKPAAVDSQANASDGHQKHGADQDHTQPIQITLDSTKIALPFADTPIIRRNQEMRRGAASGSRRSSLGMRGRRASSLIDTGKSNGAIGLRNHGQGEQADSDTALPHDEVESAEFYKHIESEGLSEPRRMRQLLTWCGTRALGDKPSCTGEDGNAVLAGMQHAFSK